MHGKLKGSELAVKGDRVIALCGETVKSKDATDDPDKVTCVICQAIIFKNQTEIHEWIGKKSSVLVKLYWETS